MKPGKEAPTPSTNPSDKPVAGSVIVTGVTVPTSKKVSVTFSKALADTVTASNFAVSDGASVTSVEFNDERTVATLSINGLTAGKNYELTVSDITADDGSTLAEAFKQTFTAKEESYVLMIDKGIPADKDNTLKANGQDSTKFTVSVTDENGNIVTDVDEIELQFTTTAGNFANKTVTVQKGVAENIFTSESLIAKKEALITVTIVNASNPKLINTTNTTIINLDPNPEMTADETAGATLTDIKVETADRIALFFNKEVSPDSFLKTVNNQKQVDTSKFAIQVTDKANSSTPIVITDVYAFSSVENNPKALYVYLGTGKGVNDRKYLTDNSEVKVEFTDKSKALPVTSTKSAILQDVTAPGLLSVTNEGLTKVILTYSEAVNWKAPATSAANLIDNYVLDGVPLKNAIYGDSLGKGSSATIEIEGFDLASMTDKSNKVIIHLGKDKDGKQIYLKSGIHSIQASNIGDAANITDVNSNKLVTQTLDFTIAADDTLVTGGVTVQSPEQYLVKLSKQAEDALGTLRTHAKLQAWNATTAKWEDLATHGNGINIRAIGTAGTDFIVETTLDWTKWYDTATTYFNYYNSQFRLFVGKGVLVNPANGKANEEIIMLLNESGSPMNAPDVVSPIINDVTGPVNNVYTISLSEPVQVPDMMQIDVTPNQTQVNKAGVPEPTVSFIKNDNSETIPANITGVNDDNTQIMVTPKKALTAGIWKVVVYHISDDVGNTAATLVRENFEVKGPDAVKPAGFKAIWIVAVPANTTDPIAGGSHTDDVVYIKYNQNIATAGASANVIATSNYQVNGYSIPVSTQIDTSIVGYNEDVLNVYKQDGEKDTIAIHLTPGTTGALANLSNNVFIANTLTSYSGSLIENGGLKALDKRGTYFAWNYKQAATDLGTVAKLQAAINNDDNVEVQATGTLDATTGEFTIGKAMTVDFANNKAKSLKIDTKSSGKVVVKNLTEVETITINAPNAEVVFENSINVTNKITLNSVLKTLTLNNGTINALDIAADHKVTVVGNNATITTVNNKNKGAVVAKSMTVPTWNQETAQELELQNVSITNLNVKEAASLVLSETASTITNINVAKDKAFASVDIKVALTAAPVIVKNAVFNANNVVTSSDAAADFASVTGKAENVKLADGIGATGIAE